MHNNHQKEHLYKILVIGDLGVGKTSIIKRYVHHNFSPNYRATIGVDFALKVLNWDQETVRLQLWDIAGILKLNSNLKTYIERVRIKTLVVSCKNKDNNTIKNIQTATVCKLMEISFSHGAKSYSLGFNYCIAAIS